MNQYSSIFFILSIHRFHNCLISSISEEVYLVMFGSRYDNKERPSSAGYFAHKHSINHQMLDNFPLSLPAASLPILPLLFFYNLCVGVKRTLISFCWLKAAHELMLVSLERTNDSLGSSNFYPSTQSATNPTLHHLFDSCHPVHPWLGHSLSFLLVISRNRILLFAFIMLAA